MTPEQWQRVFAVVRASHGQAENQRASFLAANCANDEEVLKAAQSLVEQMGSFLESSVEPQVKEKRSTARTDVTDAWPGTDASRTEASPNPERMERTRPSSPEAGALGRGVGLARYVVLNKLGSGGMGVVYAAYDPELDRKVALKLLRADAAEESSSQAARARLLREAQAMARLSHPNVIAVHDVGTLDQQIFIAMEFVEGQTLTRWLKEKERAARHIVEVFVQAGRGLAAAHAAGLVHRDFKPDNVLIGNDGRVKVLDFGLARAAEDGAGLAPTLPAQLEDGPSSPRALETPLTRSGAILGTPAYMSPEQLLGKLTDPRTDQFSFCVALYEALYGERPFHGDSLETLAQQLTRGKIKEVEKPSRVPARVRQVLRRGLRPSPDERYPSMQALLEELGKDPRAFRRRALAAASVAIGLEAVGIGYRQVAYQQSQICKGAERKLAGVWDEERRGAVSAAFLATAKPFAADAFRGVERALDAYSQGWVAMHTDACAATRLRGEQSEELLDLRMQCLSERRRELKSLVEIFTRPDPSVVENAVQAAVGLTPLNGCANAAALKAPVRPPEDPPTRARVEQHRNALAEIKALRDTGKYARALEMAKPVATASREMGYKPLEAEALLMLGDLLKATSQHKEAEGILYDAAAAAERARHAEVKAKAWTLLALVVSSRESRMEEGLRLARQSGAVVELLDNPPDLNSELQQVLGTIALHRGKHEEALAHLKQALEIREKALGPDHPDVAKTLTTLGNVLKESARYEESLTYLQRAVQTSEAALGSEHPLVAEALTNWGNLLRRQGKLDAALDAHRRALAIREKVYGPESPRVAGALMNVGLVLRAQGRHAEALEHQRRSLNIQERALGLDNVELVPVLTNLGNASEDMGNFDASLDYHRRALAIAEEAYGPEHPKLARVLNNLGSALHSKEDFPSALLHFRRALAIREKALGAEHPEVATTLLNLGLTLRDQNKRANFELARDYFRRALAIHEKVSGPQSPGVADALAELGKLIADRDPPKALAHFQRALEIREKTLPADSPVVGMTLAWIGRTYLDLKHPLAAKDRLERASKLLEAGERDPDNLAWTHFLLARALWDGHFDNERAVTLAQHARAALFKAGKTKSKTFRDIESWLSARPKTQASLD
jgi:tetratricopeptide (TPR) repeat protein/predicted Ser/Thr protein kinase